MEDCIHVEEVKLKTQDEVDDEESFCEAFEEFPLYDCCEDFDKSMVSDFDTSSIVTLDSDFKMGKPSPTNLLRRRYSPSYDESMDSVRDGSLVSFGENYVTFRDEKFESFPEMNGTEESEDFSRVLSNAGAMKKLNFSSESAKENGIEENKVNFPTGYEKNARVNDFLLDDIRSVRETHDAQSSFLMMLAGLVMKAIGYQFNLLISFFRFPIWVTSLSFMFVMDPFRAIKQGRDLFIETAFKILSSIFVNLPSYLHELCGAPQSLMEFVLSFIRGLLWAMYVGVILMALLVSAFLVGGIFMKVILEEPVSIKEKLDFDYTGESPVVFVPIIGCSQSCYGKDYHQKLDVAKVDQVRVIPPGHKLQATVSLTLPESEYNRNLGIFQVRVDFLAVDGKVIASARRPSMLHFKSQPIQLLFTFLKLPPLLYGLASETQDLKIQFEGFTEAAANTKTPTACLKVAIEQRAELQRGAGIPVIHSASLTLESQQPGLKRLIWYWRKTLFVWFSMTIFTTELLLFLLCCSPIIIMPRRKLGGSNSPGNGAPGKQQSRSVLDGDGLFKAYG